MCPAVMGKCRCALRPESMALDYERPEVVSPPSTRPPAVPRRPSRSRSRSTRSAARSTTIPPGPTGSPTTAGPPRSARSRGSRTRQPAGSDGAGRVCSAAPPTPSSTRWSSSCETSGSSWPQRTENARLPVERRRACLPSRVAGDVAVISGRCRASRSRACPIPHPDSSSASSAQAPSRQSLRHAGDTRPEVWAERLARAHPTPHALEVPLDQVARDLL